MKTMKLCMAAVVLAAGASTAEIRIIQAEDAVTLGTNYSVVTDVNVPPYAFNTNYITPLTTKTSVETGDRTIYSVGNLTSNALYDLYMRVHVGPGTYTDDSLFINADGFGTNSFNFAYQNGIAGRTGLDGQACTAAGFHWIKMNGEGDLGWLNPFNAGAGTNLLFAIAPREDGLDVDALAFVSSGLEVTDEMLDPDSTNVLWITGYLPAAPTTDSTPLIEAYFLDGKETVNTSNITMTVNGSVVSGVTSSYTNYTTTVSYTPSTPLDMGATHTAKVVVASTPSGTLVTNEWTFEVQAYPIIYMDASSTNTIMATLRNGPVGAGTALVTSASVTNDALWTLRTDFGVDPSVTNGPTGTHEGGTLLESHDWRGDDNVPRLKTSVSGLSSNTYAVYVYFWNAGGWTIRAGLEDTPGTNTLEQITISSTNAVQVGSNSAGHNLYRAFLGYAEGTSIDVFVEDLPGTGSTERTWYDGIGYQQTAGPTGPTVDPVIQTVNISGGTVTLSWTAENKGTYSIQRKTDLTDATWNTVVSNLPSGNQTTNVTASGADQEFYQIKGE